LPNGNSFTIEELKCAGEAIANKKAGVCHEFGKTSEFFSAKPLTLERVMIKSASLRIRDFNN